MRKLKKAIFLDKDGTLINDVPHNVDPDLVTLTQHASRGLQLFSEMGYRLIVVSNQPGIAWGYFEEAALIHVRNKLDALLQVDGIQLDGYYYCPHHASGLVSRYVQICECRKPMPGMLLKAAAEHGIDLRQSWMVGDILHDVEAGQRAGCKTVLIDNGNETEWVLSPQRKPHITASDLYSAALLVAAETQPRPVSPRTGIYRDHRHGVG